MVSISYDYCMFFIYLAQAFYIGHPFYFSAPLYIFLYFCHMICFRLLDFFWVCLTLMMNHSYNKSPPENQLWKCLGEKVYITGKV